MQKSNNFCNSNLINNRHKQWKICLKKSNHSEISNWWPLLELLSHFSTFRWVYIYNTCVLGWLLKSLNLITAPSSVSDDTGSVTWLATRQLKIHALSWRNHIEKLTTLWPQTVSFCPKIFIFIFHYLNAKLLGKSNSSWTVMWQLSNQFSKQPDLTKS